MKNKLTIRALACCAAFAFTSLSAIAQTGSDTARPTTTDRMAESSSIREQSQPNYSWLGLLGLAGLVGLFRKSQDSRLTETAQVRHA